MKKPPYTGQPKNVSEFFEKIKTLGIPPKVNLAYLPTIGFKSSNDRYLVGVSKSLGFVDSSGVPTERWQEYKDKNKAKQVMTSVVKTVYADLFNTYPNAHEEDSATIQNYFAAKWGVSEQLAKLMEQTFKELCGLADFKAVVVTEPGAKPTVPTVGKVTEMPPSVKPVTININIQLSLPATEDAAIYDKLFEALKKHLFS
jgi:hypothetical protein